MNTPTNYMNAKKRVIFRTAKGRFYATTNGKTTMNPKAVYMKNTGKKVANLASVPSPIRPARLPKKPVTKGSKMMAGIRGNIKKIYRPTNNMMRVAAPGRSSPSKKNKPNLSNAVARMKAGAAKLKANRVSTKFMRN